MLINTISHTLYSSQRTDSPAPFTPDLLTQRPVDKNDRSSASQSDQYSAFSDNSKTINTTEKELSKSEQKQIEELKARDREVRAHEAAHKNAAGSLAKGGAQYSYQTGPDGRRYAVGGEVSIDTSKEQDPTATIRKAQKIRRAANAPAKPSGQDRSVAAQATKMETEARQELNENSATAENSVHTFLMIFSASKTTIRAPGTLLNVNA